MALPTYMKQRYLKFKTTKMFNYKNTLNFFFFITTTLFLDDADVEFVSWCGSIYARFQNYCKNESKTLQKCGFCC